MKKKLVLSLLVVALLVTLAAAALAIQSPDPNFPYLYKTDASYCKWSTVPEFSEGVILPHPHVGECEVYCRHCGWGTPPVTTETKTVSSTTAVVKTTTGQRLIIRDKASFSGKVIGYVKCGTQVCVQSDHGKFALILCECGGKTVSGFVWKKDLHNMETVTYSYEVEIPQPQPEPQQILR